MLVTALVTPFRDGGASPDADALARLVEFQVVEGADRVLLAGSTGEGALLDVDERASLVRAALAVASPDRLVVSIGAARLPDVLAHARAALDLGVADLLLADCPYIGPSSAALCDAWFAPVAREFPDARLVAYAIPGRTGTELLPDDLARLVERHPNVVGVKDATRRLARMVRVRELCGDGFAIYCGDDELIRSATLDPAIRADGAYSVVANLAPAAVGGLVRTARGGDPAATRRAHEMLAALFGIVSVSTDETREVGGEPVEVPCRARNPVPVKAALGLLEVLDPVCRPPLAGLGPRGLERVRAALAATDRRWPDVLAPLRAAFARETAAP